MKKTLFLLFILSLITGILVTTRIIALPKHAFLLINSRKIDLEASDTPDKIIQGLSGRKEIGPNEGMFFVFEKAGRYPFWMKEMLFDLDFIFFLNQRVVDLQENVPAPRNNQTPITIQADVDFNRVLEVPAGTIKNLGIKIGNWGFFLRYL